MKATSSSGYDDINPTLVAPLLHLVAEPLAVIFNSSFNTGIVPNLLKSAIVTPIYKQGLRNEVSNYRPISILPYFSKLIEKIMYSRLYNYIEKKHILYQHQHGFRSGHSTALSLLSLHDNSSAALTEVNILWGFSLMLLRPSTL